MVAATGLEPVTLSLWVSRSNQLSYAAITDNNLSQFVSVGYMNTPNETLSGYFDIAKEADLVKQYLGSDISGNVWYSVINEVRTLLLGYSSGQVSAVQG